jgi:hypothetical protein
MVETNRSPSSVLKKSVGFSVPVVKTKEPGSLKEWNDEAHNLRDYIES